MGVIRCFRHAESVLGDFSIYAGNLNTPLSAKGIQHVIDESKQPFYKELDYDIVFTSAQIRSIQSACLFLSYTVPQRNTILFNNDLKMRKTMNSIKCEFLPVVSLSDLNERNYGVLEGLTKKEAIDIYGEDIVFKWRRDFNSGAPKGELFTDVVARVKHFLDSVLVNYMSMDMSILIVAHQNSLRALYYLLMNCTPEVLQYTNFKNFKMFEFSYDCSNLNIISFGENNELTSNIEGD